MENTLKTMVLLAWVWISAVLKASNGTSIFVRTEEALEDQILPNYPLELAQLRSYALRQQQAAIKGTSIIVRSQGPWETQLNNTFSIPTPAAGSAY